MHVPRVQGHSRTGKPPCHSPQCPVTAHYNTKGKKSYCLLALFAYLLKTVYFLRIFCRRKRKKKTSTKCTDSGQTRSSCRENRSPPLKRRAGRNRLAAAAAVPSPNYLFLSGRTIRNLYKFASSSGSDSRRAPAAHLSAVCPAPKPCSAPVPGGMLCGTAQTKTWGQQLQRRALRQRQHCTQGTTEYIRPTAW